MALTTAQRKIATKVIHGIVLSKKITPLDDDLFARIASETGVKRTAAGNIVNSLYNTNHARPEMAVINGKMVFFVVRSDATQDEFAEFTRQAGGMVGELVHVE